MNAIATRTNGSPVDLAVLLRTPRAAAIGELRRFQGLHPEFEAPVRALRLDDGVVAFLVEPGEAASLVAFLRDLPAYRGTCRWERPSDRRAPVVANKRRAVDAPVEIRVYHREHAVRGSATPRAFGHATSGIGSATRDADSLTEVEGGAGRRLLRPLPAPRPRRHRLGTRVAQGAA